VEQPRTLLDHANKAHSEWYEACRKAKQDAEVTSLEGYLEKMRGQLQRVRERLETYRKHLEDIKKPPTEGDGGEEEGVHEE
jgi:hypothetical protein